MKSAVANSPQTAGQDRVLILFCVAAVLLGAAPVLFSWPPLPTFDFFHEHSGLQIPGRVLLLGVTYMLSVWIKLDVVNPRHAVMWYLAGLFFFQSGPTIYQGFNDLRQAISGAF